jgi:LmbE family N-acetylglucosaminyl deacetylase
LRWQHAHPAREFPRILRQAADILGAASVSFEDLPDNPLDTVPLLEITQRVEAQIAQHKPATVFTHHAGELNIDHRRVHQAVITACRPRKPPLTATTPPGSVSAKRKTQQKPSLPSPASPGRYTYRKPIFGFPRPLRVA